MSTYVVRIRNSRMGDGSRRGEKIKPELILGLVKTSGAELTYIQAPSPEYPLTLVCNDPDDRAVSRFLDALGKFDGVRIEAARLP
jgi:hypothetical protein